MEGLIAIAAGAVAGSISLVGFGVDSFIEVASGSALLWRMSVDADECRRARTERTALRIVGVCFLGLAAYVGYEAVRDLIGKDAPGPEPAGDRARVRVPYSSCRSCRAPSAGSAQRLGSAAMHADARQTEFCTYLSAILLGGLLLNTTWGLWWADPVAALLMVPIIAKEGIDGLRNRACC